MAITTLDGLIASAKQRFVYRKDGGLPGAGAGTWASHWTATGQPGAGSYAIGNTTTGVVPNAATAGALAFSNPGGGQDTYLARVQAIGTVVGGLALFDRAWHAGSFAPTNGAYAGYTGATLPTRPSNGAFEVWAEVATTLSATAHNLTVTYVNQDGTTGRTGTIVLPASAPAGRMYPMAMQAADSGVRQITAISGSSAAAGAFNLLLLRRLFDAPIAQAFLPQLADWAVTGLPELFDDTCLMLATTVTSGTTSPIVTLTLDLAQG
jgi:hypothetical protein